jgi:uncharacterized linocin/CFP29 family protein
VNHLLGALAPISEGGWELLDQEARERLTPALGARKLIDFDGPNGWKHSATNLGRTQALSNDSAAPGISARQRRVLPLIELRADFALSREELRDASRGAEDVDLGPLDHAAHQLAVAEGAAIFHGWGDAIGGIAAASPHTEPAPDSKPEDYARRVAAAIEVLLGAGIGGPYALAAGSGPFRAVTSATEHGGYPLRQHLEKILGGPVVWVPGLSGAVVLSTRGGDFLFDAGQDLSIGYDSHDADEVRLYLQESFSFRVATPEASVPLTG